MGRKVRQGRTKSPNILCMHNMVRIFQNFVYLFFLSSLTFSSLGPRQDFGWRILDKIENFSDPKQFFNSKKERHIVGEKYWCLMKLNTSSFERFALPERTTGRQGGERFEKSQVSLLGALPSQLAQLLRQDSWAFLSDSI